MKIDILSNGLEIKIEINESTEYVLGFITEDWKTGDSGLIEEVWFREDYNLSTIPISVLTPIISEVNQ